MSPPGEVAFEKRALAARIHERLAEAMDAQRLVQAPKRARPYLIDPLPPTTVAKELARLAEAHARDGRETGIRWHSPLRTELFAAFLIERVMIDNLWAGDRLTEKGWRELAQSQTGD